MSKKIRQVDRILDHLEAGNTLTRLESWSTLGVLEAPARISELRALGHNINTKMIKVINRFGESVSVAEWSMA